MRNPLLYSEPNELEQHPTSPPLTKETSRKPSFLFYFIVLANSLLVLCVLGFIWFLFFKSPDIHLKEISDRLLSTSTEQQQSTTAPKAQTEVITSPSQQEKDEIQQVKLKQMRERKELTAERAHLEKIKAEIENEKVRASEAQLAIGSLKNQDKATNTTQTAHQRNEPAATSTDNINKQAVELKQIFTENLNPTTPIEPATPSVTGSPATNTTSSQVDRIIEALKNQQQKTANSN